MAAVADNELSPAPVSSWAACHEKSAPKNPDLFKAHGDMTDCVVLTDDAGVNRGFGFVTYAEKAMAEAAIKALDGHRINGRRIGVRDADDKKKGGKKERKEPEGLKPLHRQPAVLRHPSLAQGTRGPTPRSTKSSSPPDPVARPSRVRVHRREDKGRSSWPPSTTPN